MVFASSPFHAGVPTLAWRAIGAAVGAEVFAGAAMFAGAIESGIVLSMLVAMLRALADLCVVSSAETIAVTASVCCVCGCN